MEAKEERTESRNEKDVDEVRREVTEPAAGIHGDAIVGDPGPGGVEG